LTELWGVWRDLRYHHAAPALSSSAAADAVTAVAVVGRLALGKRRRAAGG
jgi:hypothetical protein